MESKQKQIGRVLESKQTILAGIFKIENLLVSVVENWFVTLFNQESGLDVNGYQPDNIRKDFSDSLPIIQSEIGM